MTRSEGWSALAKLRRKVNMDPTPTAAIAIRDVVVGIWLFVLIINGNVFCL